MPLLSGIDNLLPFLVVLSESWNAFIVSSLRGYLVHEGGYLMIIINPRPWRGLILLVRLEQLLLTIPY